MADSSAAATAPVTRVAVLGTGYVGLTVGVCLSQLGHSVICADIDASRVERLGRGEVPFVEPGLESLVCEALQRGAVRFVLGVAGAVADAEFVFICVATPRGEDGAADLTALRSCVVEVGPLLAPGAIVVTKSTVPIGTSSVVSGWLDRDDVAVVSNPEFLREGSAVHDFLHPDRIVLGSENRAAARRVRQLYDGIDAPTVITDSRTAEMIKYTANAFLATRLSFINEVSTICDALGADIDGLVAGLGSDHRIGLEFLSPGPGWGGSCLPKDTRALLHMAASAGLRFELLEQVIASNERQIDSVVRKITVAVGGVLRGSVVAVLGLAFKAHTDDVRDSPAIIIIGRLAAAGATVRAYDPAVRESNGAHHLAGTSYEAAEGADAVVVLTEWPEFVDLDLEKLAAMMRGRAVVDARNMLDKASYTEAGYQYVGLGR